MGTACLSVPSPHATDDHQRNNAEALLKKGACEMLLERELGDGGLTRAISNLMQDSDRLEQIGQQARGLARIDAARLIVDEMLGVARVEPLAGQAVTPATENKEDTE
jgi:UDP-N-acetylglucosamine--N-acetylmuramyl-(pentapeptide) pyrophosphoryl-undecaprenol N-acetylglucosamine transferase